MQSERPRDSADGVWAPFFWAAVALAVLPGFGLGGALFLFPSGAWWTAAARAHGQAQLFGWAGLMVLGVGFHFLPRLRGRALSHPEQTRTVLSLLVGGLVLRLITEPLLNANPETGVADLARVGVVLSAVLELAGASVALGLLALTVRGNPPVSSRGGLLQVLPLLGAAFAGLWLALLVNLAAVVAEVMGNSAAMSGLNTTSTLLALYLFLVPISAGLGARVFPLHFAARPPQLRVLQVGLVLLIAGLALRLVAPSGGSALSSVARLVLALALVLFVIGLRVFATRRQVPGGRQAWYADAAQWHGLSAVAWLALNAVLLVASATGWLAVSFDVERHVLGAGFVTLLILGEGVKLLPGFARRAVRSEALVWLTLVVGNLAALLRVGPLLGPQLFPGGSAETALAGAGLAGLVAVVAFALNVGPPL